MTSWRRGDEVQAEEDARGDEHDERVERDLAQEERPVVGEDLVEQDAPALGHAQALVEPADAGDRRGRARGRLAATPARRVGARWRSRTLPEPGADGLVVAGLGPQEASRSRSTAAAAAAGGGRGRRPGWRPSSRRTATGGTGTAAAGGLLVQAHGAAGVGAHLRVRQVALRGPRSRARAWWRCPCRGGHPDEHGLVDRRPGEALGEHRQRSAHLEIGLVHAPAVDVHDVGAGPPVGGDRRSSWAGARASG